MTIAIGHTVILTDRDAVQVSTARSARIAVEVLDLMRRNLSAMPSDSELIACANNLAQAWGEFGVLDGAPEGASER